MKEVKARLRTRCRGSYLWRRQGLAAGTLGGRPVLGVIRPTVMRPFESDVEQVAQVHAEVRIGATTCRQGNWSMPDAAVANRELVRVHGPRDWASSPPRRSALLLSLLVTTEIGRPSVELERCGTPQLLRVHNRAYFVSFLPAWDHDICDLASRHASRLRPALPLVPWHLSPLVGLGATEH